MAKGKTKKSKNKINKNSTNPKDLKVKNLLGIFVVMIFHFLREN